ncbi:MAG: hypothetical protein J6Y78_00670 [Paludibacteraceae bacterium]|nr:hypothetical protein [Paludibacteraceae bacterium]
MNIKDMITLLGAGYKPADIKDISVLANEDSDIVTLASSVKSMDELKNLIALSTDSQEDPDNQSEETHERDEQPAENENAKSQSDEIEKLRNQIAEMQEENRRRDLSGGARETDEDLLKSLMDSCY